MIRLSKIKYFADDSFHYKNIVFLNIQMNDAITIDETKAL